MKKFLIAATLSLSLGVAGVSAFAAGSGASTKEAIQTNAADYSSTIRIYVDLGWDNINYVRVGGKEEANNCVLTSSNAKYNQSLGKYVKDVTVANDYDKMSCYFSQSGTWWEYKDDGGWVPRTGGYKKGYEYKITGISYDHEWSGTKYFKVENVYEIGEITDNAENATFYFVDGHSWHASRSVTAYFWGGTATCAAFPGETMTDSKLRLKAFVGSTEYSGLFIMQYTISGSAAYVKFSNNNGGAETGDLRLTNGGIYFFGVDAGTYQSVVELLVSLKSQLGSYTYGGRSFTDSICALTQTKAKTFVDTFDDLDTNHGSGVASSVEGSGIITYTSPETSTTTTGEVSLSAVRTELVRKYPSISSSNVLSVLNGSNSTFVVILAGSLVILTVAGGYFFLRKKKEN